MKRKRPRPWWFHLISYAVLAGQLFIAAGLLYALFRLGLYLLTGKLLWP